MRVLVNSQNIAEYGLDTVTGNSVEDLLAISKKMKADGYDMYVNIPDVEGGDTDIPAERNVFKHFGSDLPEPDGTAHEQLSIDLTDQATVDTPCHYRHIKLVTGKDAWVCNIHDVPSKHKITSDNLNPPCLVIDPIDVLGG